MVRERGEDRQVRVVHPEFLVEVPVQCGIRPLVGYRLLDLVHLETDAEVVGLGELDHAAAMDQHPGFLEKLAAAPVLNPSGIQQPPSLDIKGSTRAAFAPHG